MSDFKVGDVVYYFYDMKIVKDFITEVKPEIIFTSRAAGWPDEIFRTFNECKESTLEKVQALQEGE